MIKNNSLRCIVNKVYEVYEGKIVPSAGIFNAVVIDNTSAIKTILWVIISLLRHVFFGCKYKVLQIYFLIQLKSMKNL